jgi:glycogen debranching enzyme
VTERLKTLAEGLLRAGWRQGIRRDGTPFGFTCLALTALPEEVRRRLAEEHLLDSRPTGAPVGIPSVSMEEPTFRAGFDRFRCWRGPSWVNTAWLLVPPLRELGYEDKAQRIVRSLADTVERRGFREYYNPLTGKGHGARDFGWSTLVVDL